MYTPALQLKKVYVLGIILGSFLVLVQPVFADLTISGSLLENDGSPILFSGDTVTVAVGTSTPSLHSVETDFGGVYEISIPTSTASTTATWSSVTGAGNETWRNIAYGNGRFVVVSCGTVGGGGCTTNTDTRTAYSTNGSTYTRQSAVGDNDSWQDVVYGAGKFVAVASAGDNRVMYSPDGITWAAATALGDNDEWMGITYGEGRFVAVGQNGDRFMYSDDGITWIAATATSSGAWQSVAYGDGVFVAVSCGATTACSSSNGGHRVATSSDGITWTTTSAASNNDQWQDIAFGDGRFYAVAWQGDDRRMYSDNEGSTWTTVAGSGPLQGIAYANGTFVTVQCGNSATCTSASGFRVNVSVDKGLTWTASNSGTSFMYGVTYGMGRFVTIAEGGISLTTDAGFGENTPLTIYINGETEKGAILGLSATHDISSVTGMDIYYDTLRIQNLESGVTLDLADADFYDYDNDRDIGFDSDAGTTTIGSSATTTDFVIASGTTVEAPQRLYLYDDFTQSGTFDHQFGTTYFAGNSTQIATGTLSTASAFYDVSITNTSGSGPATQSVEFKVDTDIRTFHMAASTSAEFLAGTTLTVEDIDVAGTSASSPVWLRSSSSGQPWYIDVTDSQFNLEYVNVRDSVASTTLYAELSTDAGGNTNWDFSTAASVWNSTDWTKYDTITVQQEHINSDLTNFPVYVNLADLSPSFWNTVREGGGDIRVTTDAGTPVEVAREVVFASRATETGELYFKAPTLSSTTDTVFRIYFNGENADYARDATYGLENVWDTGIYSRVFHFKEYPRRTTVDSTSNEIIATLSAVGAEQVPGQKFGTGLSLDGVSGFAETSFGGLNYYSAWFKTNKATGDQHIVGSYNDTNALNRRAPVVRNGNAGFSIRNIEDPIYTAESAYFVADNEWRSMYVSILSGDQDIYVDGQLRYSTSSSLAGVFTSTEAAIGRDNTLEKNDYFRGVIDEIRLYTAARSDDWLAAEFVNLSTTTDFYTVSFHSPIVGSSTIAAHDAGQVSNAFNFQNKNDEELFAFKLTPNSGSITVTNLVFNLTGVKNVSDIDFSDVKLVRDVDDNGSYIGVIDTPVTTGSAAISGTTGTITFSGDFAVSATDNYLVVADWNAPQNGSYMRMELLPSGVTATDENGAIDIFGSLTGVQHNRNNRGGAGATNQDIGGAPPAGAGTQTGGGNSGGEQIGNDPNYRRPSSYSGDRWGNASSAYDATDNTRAFFDFGSANAGFGSLGYAIPSQNEIVGIEVRLEASSESSSTISASLSWNNGTSYTSTKTTPAITTTDAVYTLGGPTDTWGRSWTVGELTNSNFLVRLVGNTFGESIDEIQVRVYYQTTGGGGGGGADI